MFLPRFLRTLLQARQRAQLPVTLTRRRIYILPTRAGLVFGAFLVAMLVAAVNYTNNLAFLLTFVLGSIGVLSSIHAYANLAGLMLVRIRPQPVFCGQEMRLTVTMRAGSRERRMLRVALGAAWSALSLEVGVDREVELTVPTVCRGLLPVGQIVISTVFPLGLFRAWSPLLPDAHGLVYARPLATHPGDWPWSGTGREGGSGAPAPAGEFSGLRPHHPEDGMARVSWKASARGQGLMTREYEADRGGSVLFDWQVMRGVPYEERISRLTALVRDAEREGLRYGLRLPGRELLPSRGSGHLHCCLEALALLPEAS